MTNVAETHCEMTVAIATPANSHRKNNDKEKVQRHIDQAGDQQKNQRPPGIPYARRMAAPKL